jgi:hypothetical protein
LLTRARGAVPARQARGCSRPLRCHASGLQLMLACSAWTRAASTLLLLRGIMLSRVRRVLVDRMRSGALQPSKCRHIRRCYLAPRLGRRAACACAAGSLASRLLACRCCFHHKRLATYE